MQEADMAVFGFACTFDRMEVVHCLPSVTFQPIHFFSRYPLETTKMWNLFKLLTPISWFWTFLAIASTVIILKLFTIIGAYFGCPTAVQDITLVPFRYSISNYTFINVDYLD